MSAARFRESTPRAARMPGETLSYLPLAKVSAVLVSADTDASRATCVSLRMRSPTALLSYARSSVVHTVQCWRDKVCRGLKEFKDVKQRAIPQARLLGTGSRSRCLSARGLLFVPS